MEKKTGGTPMNPGQKAQAWRYLSGLCNRIADPLLRAAYLNEFQNRAKREWQSDINVGSTVLSEWEVGFLKDIKAAAEYNINTRIISHKNELKQAQLAMRQFISDGGSFYQIPEHIRSPFIRDLYYTTLFKEGNEILENIEHLINNVLT